MFDIVFLGTSASAPSIYRGLSSAALLAGEERFLIDCGEGTQRQILRSGIGFKRLNRIFLTHSHLDHILGLGGLVSTFTRWESMDEIFVYGGKSTLERVQTLLFDVVLRQDNLQVPVHLNVVTEGEVYRGSGLTVSAFPVVHRGADCYGYIFEEDSHRPFLVEKAEALGIPAGPERGRLVKGETVTLADGTVVKPEMVLGETIPGLKAVFTGDTARTDNLRSHVAGADALVTEATFLDTDADIAGSYGHITAKQAAELAQEMDVRHLLLTHISRRYREYDVIREATSVFPQSVVARDLDHYRFTRGEPMEKLESDR